MTIVAAEGDSLVFAVNGERFQISTVDPSTTLLEFLRSNTRFKGTKLGCGEGGCGACVVLLSKYDPLKNQVESFTISSCLTLLCSVDKCAITTTEGLGNSKDGFHPIHQRIAGFHASQCGFCTPGMCVSLFSAIVNAKTKPMANPPKGFSKLTISEAEKSISGNLCRCTGYRPIADACKSFAFDVDLEDLGVNSFWKKGDSTQEKASSLPYYNANEPVCTFPDFLKNEIKFSLLKKPKRYPWLSPVSINELQSMLKSNSGENDKRVKLVVGNTGTGYYKQGPCYHCGVTSTPLWRNGPPDKPVLCNACGSRWRTKGSLTNYTPLHSRAGPGELEDHKVSKVKNLPIKSNEPKVIKRKLNPGIRLVKGVGSECNRGLQKVIDEDTSNRSSSGSAMSNSGSCVQFDCADTSDLTGQSQSIVWDSTVPSRKRTCVNRPTTTTSALEELTRDLYTILHEQQSSQYSKSCESDLIFESDTPMVSVEIGHGSVLIQHPSDIAKEEESVASSFPVVNKPQNANEAYSRLNASVHDNEGANDLNPKIEVNKKSIGLGMQHEHLRRDKTQLEIIQLLGNPYSSLCCVDLEEVLNIDEFEQHLTTEEQQQLLEYLPSTDAKQPDSLKGMFSSTQFKENMSSFQKLLAEGVFDLSLAGVKSEDCKTVRKLVLGNKIKSKWVEQYNMLKEIKSKPYNKDNVVQEEPKSVASGFSTNLKRPHGGLFQKLPGAKPTLKNPKRVMKGIYEHNEFVDNDSSPFSPKSLFISPPANNSPMCNSFIYMDESSEQDLLLEVPHNGSFPEAELLLPNSNFGAQTSTSSSSLHPRLFRPR